MRKIRGECCFFLLYWEARSDLREEKYAKAAEKFSTISSYKFTFLLQLNVTDFFE